MMEGMIEEARSCVNVWSNQVTHDGLAAWEHHPFTENS